MLIDDTGPFPDSIPIWVEEVKFLVKIEMEKKTETTKSKEVNRKEDGIPGTCSQCGGELGKRGDGGGDGDGGRR